MGHRGIGLLTRGKKANYNIVIWLLLALTSSLLAPCVVFSSESEKQDCEFRFTNNGATKTLAAYPTPGLKIRALRVNPRELQKTLFGKIMAGTGTMEFTPAGSSEPVSVEVPVIVKEFDADLVARGMTRSGNRVAEKPEEELRLHREISASLGLPAVVDHQARPHLSPFVYLYGIVRDPERKRFYAVMEHCRAELFDEVIKHKVSLQQAQMYFAQLVVGMAKLHAMRIPHRDVSCENILFDHSNQVKVCDFGTALRMPFASNIPAGLGGIAARQILPGHGSGVKPGKLGYMAGEVYAGLSYNPYEADVWSSGIVLFIMLAGVPPYERPSMFSDTRYQRIMEGRLASLIDHWQLNSKFSPDAKDILAHMLCKPEQRWSFEQLLGHPYVQEGLRALGPLGQQMLADPYGEEWKNTEIQYDHEDEGFVIIEGRSSDSSAQRPAAYADETALMGTADHRLAEVAEKADENDQQMAPPSGPVIDNAGHECVYCSSGEQRSAEAIAAALGAGLVAGKYPKMQRPAVESSSRMAAFAP